MMDGETREAVVDRALGACFRATMASDRSVQVREVARRLRREAAEHGWPRTFLVVGSVEDAMVRAFWSRRRLVVTPLLRRRAEVLVAMGEQFEVEGPAAPPLVAGLSDPVPALLTLMRACDRLTAVQLGPMMLHPSGTLLAGRTPG